MLIPESLPDPATAFNAGSDARLEGEPLSSCPYGYDLSSHSPYLQWRAGWKHVDLHYADWVRGRWQYRRLCAARSEA